MHCAWTVVRALILFLFPLLCSPLATPPPKTSSLTNPFLKSLEAWRTSITAKTVTIPITTNRPVCPNDPPPPTPSLLSVDEMLLGNPESNILPPPLPKSPSNLLSTSSTYSWDALQSFLNTAPTLDPKFLKQDGTTTDPLTTLTSALKSNVKLTLDQTPSIMTKLLSLTNTSVTLPPLLTTLGSNVGINVTFTEELLDLTKSLLATDYATALFPDYECVPKDPPSLAR